MIVAKKELEYYNENSKYPKPKKRTENKKNKKSNVKIKVKVFTLAAITFSICLIVLLRYAYISQLKYDIVNFKGNIEELNKEKQKLALELEAIKESGLIERKAINELNMVYPKDEQVVYIEIDADKQVYNEKGNIKSQQSEGIITVIKNKINGLFGLIQ